jgi:predicted ATP-binding protein involved in virulence
MTPPSKPTNPRQLAADAIERVRAQGGLTPVLRVRIENFRGIRYLPIELDPEVTVFFGSNAAGKTTVLDAIAIGLGAFVSQFPRTKGVSFARRGDIRLPWVDWAPPPAGDESDKAATTIAERAGVERPFARITIEASSGVAWDVTKLRWKGDATKSGLGTKYLRQFLGPLILDALESGDPTGAAANPIPLVAAYGTERAVVRVPLRRRNFATAFDRFAALSGSLETSSRFKAVFEWFVSAEDDERREREARKDFNHRLPSLEWVRGAIGRAGLRCKNPRIETKPNLRMLVDFVHTDGSLEALDIASLSDGYRTHFSLIVDIARRMVQLNPSDDMSATDRGTNSAAFILIDEIDLHLDPTWQATVVKGLRDAFPRAQFVLTTHSEQVIGSVHARAVRKLVAAPGEVLIESVPFAQGASGERILIELMGAAERVPGEVTARLEEYVALVDRGEGETKQAKAMRSELDEEIGADERLRQADLEMEKRRLLAKFAGVHE